MHATPIANCIHCVALNTNFEPFRDPDTRRAVACSIPYADIFRTAACGRGKPLWGGPEEMTGTEWPRPFPDATDLDRAKDHMARSGFAGGFEVPLSISLGLADWKEPTALLFQEGLAQIGITATIDKIPGANLRTAELVEKPLPLHPENFGGWLTTPDYYFFRAFQKDRVFNSSDHVDEELERLTKETLHMPTDNADHAPKLQRMFEIAIADLPRIPLYQPALNVALNDADGYEFCFHRPGNGVFLRARRQRAAGKRCSPGPASGPARSRRRLPRITPPCRPSC